MSTELEIDASDFAKAARALTTSGFITVTEPVLEGVLHDVGTIVRRKVRQRLSKHRRSGRLQSLVSQDETGKGYDRIVRVKSGGPVAHLVAGGVRPHTFRSTKPMPIGKVGGIMGFAQAVSHPGFRGDPYFHKGVEDAQGSIDTRIEEAARFMEGEIAARVRP